MIIPEVWYFQLLKKDYKKFDLFNRIDDFVTDKQLTTQEEINNKTFFYIRLTGRLVMRRMLDKADALKRAYVKIGIILTETRPNIRLSHNTRMNLFHEFDWDNIHILDKERILYKRLLLEMIHIKKHKLGLNLQNDTFLSILYI